MSGQTQAAAGDVVALTEMGIDEVRVLVCGISGKTPEDVAKVRSRKSLIKAIASAAAGVVLPEAGSRSECESPVRSWGYEAGFVLQ